MLGFGVSINNLRWIIPNFLKSINSFFLVYIPFCQQSLSWIYLKHDRVYIFFFWKKKFIKKFLLYFRRYTYLKPILNDLKVLRLIDKSFEGQVCITYIYLCQQEQNNIKIEHNHIYKSLFPPIRALLYFIGFKIRFCCVLFFFLL